MITLHTETSQIQVIHQKLLPANRRGLMVVLGIAAEQAVQRHFIRRDAESPNKKGWPRQHFWARLAKRTAFDPSKTTEDRATVTVADPALAAKVNGATIRATGAVSPATGKPTKNIAIPMQAAAYGSWPRAQTFPGMFFIKAKNGMGGFLVMREQKGGPLTFLYRLVPQVVVPADPDALPTDTEIESALVPHAEAYLARKEGKS